MDYLKKDYGIVVNRKAMTYFAMQYSRFIKIISPKSLVEEMKEITKKAYEVYK